MPDYPWVDVGDRVKARVNVTSSLHREGGFWVSNPDGPDEVYVGRMSFRGFFEFLRENFPWEFEAPAPVASPDTPSEPLAAGQEEFRVGTFIARPSTVASGIRVWTRDEKPETGQHSGYLTRYEVERLYAYLGRFLGTDSSAPASTPSVCKVGVDIEVNETEARAALDAIADAAENATERVRELRRAIDGLGSGGA